MFILSPATVTPAKTNSFDKIEVFVTSSIKPYSVHGNELKITLWINSSMTRCMTDLNFAKSSIFAYFHIHIHISFQFRENYWMSTSFLWKKYFEIQILHLKHKFSSGDNAISHLLNCLPKPKRSNFVNRLSEVKPLCYKYLRPSSWKSLLAQVIDICKTNELPPVTTMTSELNSCFTEANKKNPARNHIEDHLELKKQVKKKRYMLELGMLSQEHPKNYTNSCTNVSVRIWKTAISSKKKKKKVAAQRKKLYYRILQLLNDQQSNFLHRNPSSLN